jgi:hypothetical protein
MDAPILTVEEAAALLRCTPDWLQRSTCPRAKIGGRVFYLRDVCLAWVRAHVTPDVGMAA